MYPKQPDTAVRARRRHSRHTAAFIAVSSASLTQRTMDLSVARSAERKLIVGREASGRNPKLVHFPTTRGVF